MSWSYRCYFKYHTFFIVLTNSAFSSLCSSSSFLHSTTISFIRLCSKICRSLSLSLYPRCPRLPVPSYGIDGGLDSFSLGVYRLVRSSRSDCSWVGEAPVVLGIQSVRVWDWNVDNNCDVMILFMHYDGTVNVATISVATNVRYIQKERG